MPLMDSNGDLYDKRIRADADRACANAVGCVLVLAGLCILVFALWVGATL